MAVLKGKVALVTGASSGIGRAAALLFAAEGARIVATARRHAELGELVADIRRAGGEALAVHGDAVDETAARDVVRTACEEFGRLDLAFNNAGTLGALGPVDTIARTDWDRTLAVNLTGAFLGAKYQVPAMLENGGGSILFTGTFVGHAIGFPGLCAYAAAKAGLIGLMRSIAADFSPRGVRANAIFSGGVDTPMGRVVANSPEAEAAIAGLHALKRMARPEEIARTALFLLSDAASFVTGAAICADGGVSSTRT